MNPDEIEFIWIKKPCVCSYVKVQTYFDQIVYVNT